MLFDPVVAGSHKGANGGGGGIELVDLVLGADLPETARIGVGRHTFEHDRCRAVREWPIDDIAVAGDPTHIGGAPEHVAFVIIKGVLVCHRRIGQIPARTMYNTLGLSGRSGCVKNEQWVFSAHLGGFAIVIRLKQHLIIVVIAILHPCGLPAGAFHDQTFYRVLAVQ